MIHYLLSCLIALTIVFLCGRPAVGRAITATAGG